MNEAGKVNEYKVDFTFGHYPLQQYLVETKPGTYQVFPFVWDSRDTKRIKYSASWNCGQSKGRSIAL